jgi:hypothetical protein
LVSENVQCKCDTFSWHRQEQLKNATARYGLACCTIAVVVAPPVAIAFPIIATFIVYVLINIVIVIQGTRNMARL